MDTPRYETLSRTTTQLGEAFYKCLSGWLADPLNTKQRKTCLEQGHRYEAVLVEQIEYLKSLPRTPRTTAAIENCQTYYTALESQIKLLERAFKSGH